MGWGIGWLRGVQAKIHTSKTNLGWVFLRFCLQRIIIFCQVSDLTERQNGPKRQKYQKFNWFQTSSRWSLSSSSTRWPRWSSSSTASFCNFCWLGPSKLLSYQVAPSLLSQSERHQVSRQQFIININININITVNFIIIILISNIENILLFKFLI